MQNEDFWFFNSTRRKISVRGKTKIKRKKIERFVLFVGKNKKKNLTNN